MIFEMGMLKFLEAVLFEFGSIKPIFLLALFLVGCVTQEPIEGGVGQSHKSTDANTVRSVSSPARAQPEPINFGENYDTNRDTSSDIEVRGTGRFIGGGGIRNAPAFANRNGDINLHFVDADVADVAKAVLGDLLKLNYVISPKVKGTLTLNTNRPIKRIDVLPSLQTALLLAGATAVEVKGVWRVVPRKDAPFQGRPISSQYQVGKRSSSFAVEIVQLNFVAATEMKRLLAPLVPSENILRVDSSANLLVLGGDAEERDAMRDQISIFDVDWMAGMSFAFVRLYEADANIIADELHEILGKETGRIRGLVRIVPVERLNALLLISPQISYLNRLKVWVQKLDRGPDSYDGLQLYVYRVQNGKAADITQILGRIFGKLSGSNQSGSSINVEGVPLAQASQAAAYFDGSGDNNARGRGAFKNKSVPQFTADEPNNSILILSTKSQYANIKSTLKRLDIRPLQVLIETTIAEVTLSDELKYGVQYYLQSGNFSVLRTATTSLTPAVPVPGFAMLFSAGKNEVILDLLESKTKVRLLSAPHMMVLNNQTATLQVGNEVPVKTQSTTNVQSADGTIVSSIEYRNTGVLMTLTPRVNDNGLVLLDIVQEVSDVSQTTTSGIDSPSFTQRKFTSSIAIQDGETVALGGLISDSRVTSRVGLPLLSEIPYLGSLFSTSSETGGRTELLVLITPHVIRTNEDSRGVTREIREKMKAISPIVNLVQ